MKTITIKIEDDSEANKIFDLIEEMDIISPHVIDIEKNEDEEIDEEFESLVEESNNSEDDSDYDYEYDILVG